MTKVNPMIGGQDYARLLAEAISPRKARGLAPPPPATGGGPISFRLRSDRLRLLDTLRARSGWNRNQIIESLLICGLSTFFSCLDDETSEDLIRASERGKPKLAVSFPSQNPTITRNKTLAFQAFVGGEAVECEISQEALREHFGAATTRPNDLALAFISGIRAIYRIARKKLLDSPGRCLLVSADF